MSRQPLLTAALAFCCLAMSIPPSGPASADIPARRAYDFVDSVGVCVHFGWRNTAYEDAYDEVKRALGDLGIRHLRQRPGSPLTIRRLVDLRVMPYYLHQLDRVAGTAHFEVPATRSNWCR